MRRQIIRRAIKSILPASVRADAKKKLIESLLGHELPGFSFSAGGEDGI